MQESLIAAVMVVLVSLASCRGEEGPAGKQGPTGPQGQTGPAGQTGAPAPKVNAVQLCPGVEPTYPTVFPEVAFCIDGVLYGTYNANTSYQYLAALPDGAYTSDGQGAPCSFTIAGCTVTY